MKSSFSFLVTLWLTILSFTAKTTLADELKPDQNVRAMPSKSFGEASLNGYYAYSNTVSGVGSYGIMFFDGSGNLSMETLNINLPDVNNGRKITRLQGGVGTYTIDDNGSGIVNLNFPDRPLVYEFVVTESEVKRNVKRAVTVAAFLTTAGLNGQLSAPTFSLI
jgi:hypothetical protein